jgi:tetratricopeptide (TPR) repeat protein
MSETLTPPDDCRLAVLRSYLDADPENPRLLHEAADLSFQQGQIEDAAALMDRLAATGVLDIEAIHLAGLIALTQGQFKKALDAFSSIRAEGVDNPPVRFNLAWAHAMLSRHEEALALLDDEVLEVSPRAPQLRIQMLHHLNRLDEGLAAGSILAARYPGNEALFGTLATLALDAEEIELARHYARQAGNDAGGLAAAGILALESEDIPEASDLFERAIAAEPQNPRAWIGKGLARISQGDAAGAVGAIDRGAELFGSHLGSWIASAWAHFAVGDLPAARQRFERALALDASFAETHGGLAVLDIMEGRIDEGSRRAEVALRLDRGALGGQLARIMLLERSGQPDVAARIREKAMATPLGPDGRTIGQAMAALALRKNGPSS